MSAHKTQHGLLRSLTFAMMTWGVSTYATSAGIDRSWVSSPHLKTRIELSNHRIPDGTLNLTGSSAANLQDIAIELMRNVYHVPETIDIRPVSPFGTPPGIKAMDFTFAHDGNTFCDLRVSARQGKGLLPLILGSLPSFNGSLPTKGDFSQVDAIIAWQNALAKLRQNSEFISIEPTTSVSQCIAINRHFEAVPSLEMTVQADGRAYKLRFDEDTIYHWSPLSFEITGTASVFARHSNSGSVASEPLASLADPGEYLIDSYFRERVWQLNSGVETDVAGVRSLTSNFVYSPSTQAQLFGEVSIFRNARRAKEFFAANGLSDTVAGLFKLIVHAQFNVRGSWVVDNAIYTPPSGNNPPYIAIGDGSGSVLKNLSTDADVVTHEYAHHWVFKTLKSTEGAAAEIHEGMADFATILLNDDPCFAPSICPTNSTACFKVGQCLRHANHQLKYLDSNMPNAFHQRGQVLSGMLWDLRQLTTIGLTTMKTLFFKSLAYLPVDAGYKDVVLSLTHADQDNFQGSHICQIFDAAVKRQLIAESEDECKYPKPVTDTNTSVIPVDTLPTTTENDDEQTSTKDRNQATVEPDSNLPTSESSQDKKSSSGFPLCGVTNGASNSSTTITWFLMSVAIGPALLRRRRVRTR
jgi:hypothetical protein